MSNHNTEQYNTEWWKFNDRINEIRSKYRVKEMIGKKIVECNPPPPDQPEAALALLRNYYAAIQCEVQKHDLYDKYRTINEAAISEELKVINKWIENAETFNYSEAIINPSYGNIQNLNSPQHEYLRLKNGFYETYVLDEMQLQDSSITAQVYGRYFLFQEWLQNQIEVPEPPENKRPKFKITSKKVLLYLYRKHGALNETKFISDTVKALSLKWKSVENDYRELKHYIDNTKLTKGQRDTWDEYYYQLNDATITKQIETKLKNTPPGAPGGG